MTTIVVYGEGPHEMGPEGIFEPGADLPALPRLVHRLLNEPADVRYVCIPFRKAAHTRPETKPGSRLGRTGKKVFNAMRQAHRQGRSGLVVVMDRDDEPDAERIEQLRAGRDAAEASYPVACAVGTAVETFDAWMIVDGAAIGQAGGDGARSHPGAERLTGRDGKHHRAKARAIEILGEEDGLRSKYAIVAGCINLDQLKKCCPLGFKPFAEEVTRRLAAAIGNE
jgi:hypothetical protein